MRSIRMLVAVGLVLLTLGMGSPAHAQDGTTTTSSTSSTSTTSPTSSTSSTSSTSTTVPASSTSSSSSSTTRPSTSSTTGQLSRTGSNTVTMVLLAGALLSFGAWLLSEGARVTDKRR